MLDTDFRVSAGTASARLSRPCTAKAVGGRGSSEPLTPSAARDYGHTAVQAKPFGIWARPASCSPHLEGTTSIAPSSAKTFYQEHECPLVATEPIAQPSTP